MVLTWDTLNSYIRECIGRIDSYVQAVDEAAFIASSLVQDAVIRNLQIMAESTQRLPDNLKEGQPDVDWYKIAGFRNVLIHDYLGVDVQRVWNIVINEIPALREAIRKMLD